MRLVEQHVCAIAWLPLYLKLKSLHSYTEALIHSTTSVSRSCGVDSDATAYDMFVLQV